MAYIVMAFHSYGLYSYGLYSYGLHLGVLKRRDTIYSYGLYSYDHLGVLKRWGNYIVLA